MEILQRTEEGVMMKRNDIWDKSTGNSKPRGRAVRTTERCICTCGRPVERPLSPESRSSESFCLSAQLRTCAILPLFLLTPCYSAYTFF